MAGEKGVKSKTIEATPMPRTSQGQARSARTGSPENVKLSGSQTGEGTRKKTVIELDDRPYAH